MPLSHIRVVDLCRARTGPTCVRQLSEFGAQVIKVELPEEQDDDVGGRHGFDFQNLHPNKRESHAEPEVGARAARCSIGSSARPTSSPRTSGPA